MHLPIRKVDDIKHESAQSNEGANRRSLAIRPAIAFGVLPNHPIMKPTDRNA